MSNNGQYTTAGNQIMSLGDIGGTNVAAGQTTMAGSIPVVLASDQSTLNVELQKIGSTTLAAGQTTMAGSIPVVLASDQTGIGTRTAPSIMQDQKRAWLQNGQMFSLCTGLQTSGNSGGNFPLGVFNPSNSGKSILIFSVCVSADVKFIQPYLTYQTSNPNFASAVFPTNLKMGGAGTVTTCTTTTSSVSIVGTLLDAAASTNIDRYEMLTNETEILLPSGSANALIAWIQITNSTATSYAITIRWIEY